MGLELWIGESVHPIPAPSSHLPNPWEGNSSTRAEVTAGQAQQVEAVVDTGFTGFLTLPPSMIFDTSPKNVKKTAWGLFSIGC